MKRSEFVTKSEQKKYDVSRIKNEPDYDSSILDIINYLFDEIYKTNNTCKITIISSDKDIRTKTINSLTFTADNCLEKIKKLKTKYIDTYKQNNLVWNESGNNITLSFGTSSSQNNTQNSTTPQDSSTPDVYQQVANTLMGIKENYKLINEINKIKKLLL